MKPNRQQEIEDLNTQEGHEGSGNTCRDTADTNENDDATEGKTKHREHGDTPVFKIKHETLRDVDMTTQAR